MVEWEKESFLEDRMYLSKVVGFQLWMQREMENRVNKLPSLGYDEVAEIKVAVTTMAFKNGEIIDLLRKRG